MHGDENARDIARRLVQEAVSRADGSISARSDGPPVMDPEPPASDPGPPSPPTDARRMAHRFVLEALAAEAASGQTPPASARPAAATPAKPEPAPEPKTEPQPEPEPEATLKPEPASEPDLPAPVPPAATAAPAGTSVSPASAEAARRIVADALAAHDAQPPEPPAPQEPQEPPARPSPALQAARRIVAQSLDERAARSTGDAAPANDAEESWPTAGVDLLPVETSAPAPAPTAPHDAVTDPAAADPVPGETEDETVDLTVQIPVVALPPIFPTIGEPGIDASLLDHPTDQAAAWDDDTTLVQVRRSERLTVLDRWRARRHRKRLAAQWAPGATPQPRRTWRWVLATIIVALALGVLFPLTVAAFRSLFAL